MGKKSKKVSPFWYLKKKQTKHGLRSLAYKNGKIVGSRGYILIFSPEHPYRNNHNYVREHRLVMEKWLRKNDPNHPLLIEIEGIKYLRLSTTVHHINNCISDNRIENLMLFKDNSEHTRFHSKV